LFNFDTSLGADETSAAETGAVQCARFIIANRNDGGEIFSENFRVLFKTNSGVNKNSSFVCEGLLNTLGSGFAIELSLDSGEKFLFPFRNTKAAECCFTFRRDVIPGVLGTRIIGKIVTDFVEIEVIDEQFQIQ
jgi:hypothetical protein